MSTYQYGPKFRMEALFPPCDKHLLHDFEKQIGYELPNDYVEFLHQWNGLFFRGEEPAVRFLDEFDEYDFALFCHLYGFSDEKPLHDLRHAGEGYDFRERVPKHFIAIGDDNSWNRVAMCLEARRFGHIFFWQPGVPWEEERKNTATEEYLRPVAKSFREFWEALYISEFPPD